MVKLLNTINLTPLTTPTLERQPMILIVDDHDDSRSMLRALLEMWNYGVVEAIDGNEALAAAENIRPDLILMDVKMGKMDGFEVTRTIRRSPQMKNVPIVFLSGCAEKASKEKAFAAGGSEYLVKPLDFDELEKVLAKYIRRPHDFLPSKPIIEPIRVFKNVCILQPAY